MLRQVQVENKTTKFNHTNTNFNGGYKEYWRLTKELYLQTKKMINAFPKNQQTKMWMLFWIKTPWWCVIKPIFQIISVKKNFTGTFVYITHNGELQEQTFYNGKKKVTVQLTKIPIFQYTVTLSNADKSYLMKKLS